MNSAGRTPFQLEPLAPVADQEALKLGMLPLD